MHNPIIGALREDSNIELCVNYIEEGKCILFLGPQFAIDTEEKKVHQLLKTHIQTTSFQGKIDFTYDNLFIFKDPTPSTADKMRLTMALKKKYKEISPHRIYSKIPQIPFSAIISCSPDNFLRNAFEEKQLELFFRYYSRKGEEEEYNTLHSEDTFLYNVFGFVEDENSLITTYESFYKFIISIMGEEQQLPLELRNRIVDAKIYIFMGFDLTKWYIPLLVHKLNSFKLEQKENAATAIINNDNKLNEDTEKYFPIEMMVLNGDSIPTIDVICEKLSNNGKLRISSSAPAIHVKSAEEIGEMIVNGNIEEAFGALIGSFQLKNLDNNDIIVLQARFQELKKQINGGIISNTDATIERNKIVNALLELSQRLKN